MALLKVEMYDAWEWMGGESHCHIFYRKEVKQVKNVHDRVWKMNSSGVPLHFKQAARILVKKCWVYSFSSLQSMLCYTTFQLQARSSLALPHWATSTLHWKASFLMPSRWLLDLLERELWSTTGTLRERRCDSAQILLE